MEIRVKYFVFISLEYKIIFFSTCDYITKVIYTKYKLSFLMLQFTKKMVTESNNADKKIIFPFNGYKGEIRKNSGVSMTDFIYGGHIVGFIQIDFLAVKIN